MNQSERDELRRGLRAADCEWLLNRLDAGRYCSQELTELRSLLRREERLRVMEAGVRAAERTLVAMLGNSTVTSGEGIRRLAADREALLAATELLETEVPDGQG